MKPRPVRLGTRGSLLALAQARRVASTMRSRWPGLEVDIIEIRTRGDVSRAARLGPHLGQSFFTKEIEDALLDGRIDVGVHSCKDLASVMPPGLKLGAVPQREDPYDALVSHGARLAALSPGARVGTSSVRRERQLRLVRRDLEVLPLRGNVPTRIRAVDDGRFDAVIVASAGLHRLGMTDRIRELLDPSSFVPAAAQGALALQVRTGDAEIEARVRPLGDPASHREVSAERACMRRLAAGCQAPVGVLARAGAGGLEVSGMVVAPDATVRASVTGTADDPERLGEAVAAELLAQLGLPSLAGADWAGPPAVSGEASAGLSDRAATPARRSGEHSPTMEL